MFLRDFTKVNPRPSCDTGAHFLFLGYRDFYMCKYTRGSIKTASDMKAKSTWCLGSLALFYRSTCASNPCIFWCGHGLVGVIFPLGSGTQNRLWLPIVVSWDGWFTMFTNLGRMLWEEPKYLNHSHALQLLQLTSTRPVFSMIKIFKKTLWMATCIRSP